MDATKPWAWVSVLVALAAGPARAHGGEEHGDTPIAAPMTDAGGAQAASAEAIGTYELLLRWGPATVGEPLVIEAFVADAATNVPIEGGLKLALSGPAEVALDGLQRAPGQFALTLPVTALGVYAVTATVRGPSGIDLLTTTLTLANAPVVATPGPEPTETRGVPLLWLVLALALAAILAALGYVAGRRAGTAALGLVMVLSLARHEDAAAHGGDDHGATPAPIAASGNAVWLAKDIQFLLKVRTEPVAMRTLTERRRVVGAVTLAPGAHTSLIAPLTARVEAAPDGSFPRLGERVTRGQVIGVLVEISALADRAGLAAERARAAGERDAAAASLRALRQELTRKRALDAGLVSAQELDDLQAAIGRTQATLVGARAAVDALTLGAGSAALDLVAPIDGVIGAIHVAPGGVVDAGTLLVEVVDLARPWVAARVFEADLAAIDHDAPARVMADGGPAEGLVATPIAVSPIVDATTHTVDVIYALDGTPGLRVNQFVRVDLPIGGTHEVLAVPASAIVELDGVPSVWVKTRAERFEARPVAPGRRDGAFVEVRGPLALGERVVVHGAPFLRGAPPAPSER